VSLANGHNGDALALYSDALGERGLRAYRQAVAESAGPRSFAASYFPRING
jgi:hypothetical protein